MSVFQKWLDCAHCPARESVHINPSDWKEQATTTLISDIPLYRRWEATGKCRICYRHTTAVHTESQPFRF